MYAVRASEHLSLKPVFGPVALPVIPSPFVDYSKSIAYVPSWKVLRNLATTYFASRNDFETKVMQGIDGINLKGDASHKLTKLVYVNVDEKVYHGLYTLMNEYGQVMGWWFIRTGNKTLLFLTMLRSSHIGFLLTSLFHSPSSIFFAGKMEELEECIKKLRHRYEINGFSRPLIVKWIEGSGRDCGPPYCRIGAWQTRSSFTIRNYHSCPYLSNHLQ